MPVGFKGWAVFLGAQAALTLAWKLIYKLLENAVIGWGDDQIAAALGITSPALSTVVAWAIPFALAGLTLWGYHLYVSLRMPSGRVRFKMENGTPVVTASYGLTSVSDHGENDFSLAFDGRKRVRRWSYRLEPGHIIVVGVTIAALGIIAIIGGLVWQSFQPARSENNTASPPSAANKVTADIVWDWDNPTARASFLGIGSGMRVIQFSAGGKNISGRPISKIKSYVRSNITNKELPIYILTGTGANTSKELPEDTYVTCSPTCPRS